MFTKPPIALIVFSNDLDRFLPNIETERKVIEEALDDYDDTNRLKVIARANVSIEELFKLFNRYQGRIFLFHFAGHANGKGLLLNQNITDTTSANAEGIAALLRREVEQGILRFVFLNGCSTAPQVKALKAINVPSIIATNYSINDYKAVTIAEQFYRTWAKTDKGLNAFEPPSVTIDEAFKAALAYLKTKHNISVNENNNRGIVFDFDDIEVNEPWELYTSVPNITLPNNIINQINREITETYTTVNQNAEKIYNIDKIDKADFS